MLPLAIAYLCISIWYAYSCHMHNMRHLVFQFNSLSSTFYRCRKLSDDLPKAIRADRIIFESRPVWPWNLCTCSWNVLPLDAGLCHFHQHSQMKAMAPEQPSNLHITLWVPSSPFQDPLLYGVTPPNTQQTCPQSTITTPALSRFQFLTAASNPGQGWLPSLSCVCSVPSGPGFFFKATVLCQRGQW